MLNSYALEDIDEFFKILVECNAWYDYKMYLEGALPNVHHIELGVVFYEVYY